MGVIVEITNRRKSYDILVSRGAGNVVNSNGSYTTGVSSGETLVLPDSNITNSNGTYNVSLPATTDLTVPDGSARNSDNSWIVPVPAADSIIVPDTPWTDSDGTPRTTPATLPIVCTPAADNRSLNIQFLATYDDNITLTATADEATTWTTESLTNVATVAYEKNGGAASLPITLAVSDTLKITITRTNAALDSKVKLTN